MSTCKDCLHYECCRIWEPNEHYFEKAESNGCVAFKPKADYAPVVRCEECAYKEDCARQMVHTTRDYVLEQNISTYNKVDFCSYGEKESEVQR